jgi:hypothetical protein
LVGLTEALALSATTMINNRASQRASPTDEALFFVRAPVLMAAQG